MLEAQPPPKLVADILRQNGRWGLAVIHQHSSCGLGTIRTARNVNVFRVTRNRQSRMKLAVALIEGVGCDLTPRINVVTIYQM